MNWCDIETNLRLLNDEAAAAGVSGGRVTMMPVDEHQRRQFEAAWNTGCPQPVQQYLPPEIDEHYPGTLLELVCIDLENRWKQWARHRDEGMSNLASPPSTESYYAEFPVLNDSGLRNLIDQEQDQLIQQFAQQSFSSDSLPQSTFLMGRAHKAEWAR